MTRAIRLRSTIALALLSVGAVVACQPGPTNDVPVSPGRDETAADTPEPQAPVREVPIDPEVERRTAGGATLRVSIELALAIKPDPVLSPDEARAQRDRIRAAQLELLNVIGREPGGDVVLFDTVPFVSLSLRPAELDSLKHWASTSAEPVVTRVRAESSLSPR